MDTKFCQKCGHKLAVNDVFCNNCGAKQHDVNMDENNMNNTNTYSMSNNEVPHNNVPNENQMPYQTPYNNQAAGNQFYAGPANNGVGFGKAIELFWKHAFSFTGCSSRSEYWFSYLFSSIINIFLFVVLLICYESMIDTVMGFRMLRILLVFASIVFAFIGIGNISVMVRRLHDTNLSGGFFWLSLIPFVGGIILLVLLCQPTKPEGLNRFGVKYNNQWYKQVYAWVILVICSTFVALALVKKATQGYHFRYFEIHYVYGQHTHHHKSSDDDDDLYTDDDDDY